jgi:hypothetical protein
VGLRASGADPSGRARNIRVPELPVDRFPRRTGNSPKAASVRAFMRRAMIVALSEPRPGFWNRHPLRKGGS